MKCQRCGMNEANVSYTQVVNGNKIKLYLCDKCAKEMNIDMNFSFDFNDVFGAFFEEPLTVKKMEARETLSCDKCGTTYEEFAKTGMFGCDNCYHVFGDRLETVLKRLHGANRHTGKNLNKATPVVKVKNPKKVELQELKKELEECIKKEEYEKAAVLRDKIKLLEKELSPKERGE